MGSLSSSFIPAGRLGTGPLSPRASSSSDRSSAVKGTLRRFAPWPARTDPKDALLTRGKGGSAPWGAEAESLIQAHDKGYYHSCLGRSRKGTFRPYQPSEPQPRGAVTRRAVAQRRSRASGLTRLSAAAIRWFWLPRPLARRSAVCSKSFVFRSLPIRKALVLPFVFWFPVDFFHSRRRSYYLWF